MSERVICMALRMMNSQNAIHVRKLQKRGFEVETGGSRCRRDGLTREEGGKGEGDLSGWVVVYDARS
jgi:hypothetical protein